MLTLYLIRHGQTEWNLEHRMQGSLNSDLTDLGKSQAEKLSTSLSALNFDRIYCSTATRAIQTAELVFPNQKLALSEDLREIGMGTWEGQTYDQIAATDPQAWYNFFNAPFDYQPSANGESFKGLENRLRHFLEVENLSEKSGRIAIVSHRITLRMLLSICLADKAVFSDIDLKPTSVSILELRGNTYQVKVINDHSHV